MGRVNTCAGGFVTEIPSVFGASLVRSGLEFYFFTIVGKAEFGGQFAITTYNRNRFANGCVEFGTGVQQLSTNGVGASRWERVRGLGAIRIGSCSIARNGPFELGARIVQQSAFGAKGAN